MRGTPFQIWIEGVGGVPLSKQDWMGYPPSRTGWSMPPSKTGWGTPHPGLDGVSPHLRLDGVPPCQNTDQHNKHLLHGGRYASCVHLYNYGKTGIASLEQFKFKQFNFMTIKFFMTSISVRSDRTGSRFLLLAIVDVNYFMKYTYCMGWFGNLK